MIALILMSLIASFQTAPVATGTLSVRVVERGTKAPLAGVKVSVVNSESSPTTPLDLTTAADGTATFARLKAGVYEVRTWSETHLAIEEDPWPDSSGIAVFYPRVPDDLDVLRHFPGSGSVRVLPDRRLDLTFELPRAGVITGRLVSPASARASALVTLYTTRKARTSDHPVRQLSQSVRTDADGSFALRGLLRGTYLLTFRLGGEDADRFSEVYYPGVIDIRDATPLTVSDTQLYLSAVTLRAMPRVRISGRVEDQGDGRRELVGRDLDLTRGDAISLARIPVRRNGTFSAPHVDAGIKGLLYTRKARDGALLSAATAVLQVGADPLAGIRLKPVTPSSISGRFVYERPYEPVQHAWDPQLYVIPQGPDAWLRESLPRAQVEKGEGFRLDGIIGTHRIDARAPTGWVVAGVVLEDGRNVLDEIFEFEAGKHYENVRVLLSPDGATLEGRVAQDVEPLMQRVMVFPVDDRLWGSWRYQHVAAVERDGSFRIGTITPGREYYVATCRWPCSSRDGLEDRAKGALRIFIDRPAILTVTLKR